jgi:hypothetical protein
MEDADSQWDDPAEFRHRHIANAMARLFKRT